MKNFLAIVFLILFGSLMGIFLRPVQNADSKQISTLVTQAPITASSTETPQAYKLANDTFFSNGTIDIAKINEVFSYDFTINDFWLKARLIQSLKSLSFVELVYLMDVNISNNNAALQSVSSAIIAVMFEQNRGATLDYLVAIEYSHEKRYLINEYLPAFIEQSPIKAADWIVSKTEHRILRYLNSSLPRLFGKLNNIDRDLAFAYFEQIHPMYQLSALSGFYSKFTESEEYQTLIGMINSNVHASLKSHLEMRWAKQFPLEVANYLESQRTPSQSLADEILKYYAYENLGQAANWYLGLDLAKSRSEKVTNVISLLKRHIQYERAAISDKQIIDWIDNLSADDQYYAYRMFFVYVNEKNVDFVIENLHILRTQKERLLISHRVADVLRNISVERANDFIDSSELSEQLRSGKGIRRIDK